MHTKDLVKGKELSLLHYVVDSRSCNTKY